MSRISSISYIGRTRAARYTGCVHCVNNIVKGVQSHVGRSYLLSKPFPPVVVFFAGDLILISAPLFTAQNCDHFVGVLCFVVETHQVRQTYIDIPVRSMTTGGKQKHLSNSDFYEIECVMNQCTDRSRYTFLQVYIFTGRLPFPVISVLFSPAKS